MPSDLSPRPKARGRVSEERNGDIYKCALTLLAALALTQTANAAAPPRSWHPTAAWLREAACIRQHEGAWTSNTGNGYYGAYQFLLSTWRRAGGSGYPHQATPAEQTYRAWVIWASHGGSWSEWGTKGKCGLR